MRRLTIKNALIGIFLGLSVVCLVKFFPSMQDALAKKFREVHGLSENNGTSQQRTTFPSVNSVRYAVNKALSEVQKANVSEAARQGVTKNENVKNETEKTKKMAGAKKVKGGASDEKTVKAGETDGKQALDGRINKPSKNAGHSAKFMIQGDNRSKQIEPSRSLEKSRVTGTAPENLKTEHFFFYFGSEEMARANMLRWQKASGEEFAMRKEDGYYFVCFLAEPEQADSVEGKIEKETGIKHGRRPVF